MPAESTLGGIAELLDAFYKAAYEEGAVFANTYSTGHERRTAGGAVVDAREAIDARLRSLDGVLAECPTEEDEKPVRQYLDECAWFCSRLRSLLSGEPATTRPPGQEQNA